MTYIKPEHLAEAERLSQMYFNPRDMRDGIAAALQRISDAKDAALTAHGAEQFKAGRRAGLQEAANVTVLLDIEKPGTGPFTRQDRAIDQYRSAIRALKTQKQGAKG